MSVEDHEDGSGDGDRRRAVVDADAVGVGDAVLYTSHRNAEYRFDVADVDADWITFETGQQVHKDRFDREEFAVLVPGRGGGDEATTGAGSPEATGPSADNPPADGEAVAVSNQD